MRNNFPTHIVGVGALISNKNGDILLVRHPRRGWEFPGGQVDNGEDLITALKREVKEESGVEIEVKTLAAVYSNTKGHVSWDKESYLPTKVTIDFLCEAIGGELRSSEESLEVQWFKRNDVLEMITTESVRARAKTMLEFNGQVIYKAYTNNPYEVNKELYI